MHLVNESLRRRGGIHRLRGMDSHLAISFTWIRVKGKDSADFLGRLSTTDMRKMPSPSAARTLFLTGTSLVIAPAHLLRLSSEEFFLISEDAAAMARLEAHLEAMHFSEALEREVGISAGAFLFSVDQIDVGRSLKGAAGETIFFPMEIVEGALVWEMGLSGFGLRMSLPPSGGADLFSRQNETGFYESMRIAAKIPRFEREWREGSRALDVGFLPWIQRTKGCYPGQEVVEKSLNLGHPAKALVRVRKLGGGSEKIPLPLTVERDGAGAGELTSLSPEGLGLAVVKWDSRVPGTRLIAPGFEFIVEGD